MEEIAQRLLGNAADQALKHVVGPPLVFYEGVFPADADKADPVPEFVDFVEVFLPASVDGSQGNALFDFAENLLPDDVDAALIGFANDGE